MRNWHTSCSLLLEFFCVCVPSFNIKKWGSWELVSYHDVILQIGTSYITANINNYNTIPVIIYLAKLTNLSSADFRIFWWNYFWHMMVQKKVICQPKVKYSYKLMVLMKKWWYNAIKWPKVAILSLKIEWKYIPYTAFIIIIMDKHWYLNHYI